MKLTRLLVPILSRVPEFTNNPHSPTPKHLSRPLSLKLRKLALSSCDAELDPSMALSQRGDCDVIPKSSAMTFLSCLALVVSELETPLPHSATHKRQHFTACLGIGRRGEGGLRCKNTLFRVHTPTTLSQRQSKNRLQKKRWFFTELKKLTKKSIRVVLQEPSLVSFTLCAYPGLGLALMRHQWPHYEVGACWHDSSCGKRGGPSPTLQARQVARGPWPQRKPTDKSATFVFCRPVICTGPSAPAHLHEAATAPPRKTISWRSRLQLPQVHFVKSSRRPQTAPSLLRFLTARTHCIAVVSNGPPEHWRGFCFRRRAQIGLVSCTARNKLLGRDLTG